MAWRVTLNIFQSTPSVGRATSNRGEHMQKTARFQSTPSVGRATCPYCHCDEFEEAFQSTPSVGRATFLVVFLLLSDSISIHALRGEGDICSISVVSSTVYFNPRPPWGGRRLKYPFYIRASQGFQSTPSVGRATAKIYKYAMLCLYIVHIKLYIFATAVLFT